ncbi:hypothetical protein H4582DRAFT_2055572 [Lactarius indigo]|nr:hypothetical protein H4582DRAFT_2055572 [Lactarius indigo]
MPFLRRFGISPELGLLCGEMEIWPKRGGLRRSARTAAVTRAAGRVRYSGIPHEFHELTFLHDRGIHNVVFVDYEAADRGRNLGEACRIGLSEGAFNVGEVPKPRSAEDNVVLPTCLATPRNPRTPLDSKRV